MKKIRSFLEKLLLCRCAPAVYALLGAVVVLLYYAYRFGFVFVDTALFTPFSFILLVLALVCTGFLAVAASLRLRDKAVCSKTPFCVVQSLAEVFVLIMLFVDIGNVAAGNRESHVAAFGMGKEVLPLWLAVVCMAAAVLVLPLMQRRVLRRVLSGCMALGLVVTVYASLFPTSAFAFSATPVVFDNGTDYSVVFATNDNATAYIEYDYNGTHYKTFAADNGRKVNSKIHTIRVPYAHLSENQYKVGATRVLDELTYGGRTGKTIESDSIAFHDQLGDRMRVLTVSDWHTRNRQAAATAQKMGDYDAVILLGDAAPGIMYEDEVAKYVVGFGAQVSRGEMPVIFARGNHETRGRMAAKLAGYLGIDSFYYTARLGNVDLVVLDSGEDKEDSHPEYGGMDDYAANRQQMVNWLNGLEKTGRHTIALSHAKEICIEPELSRQATAKLDALGVSLLATGHWHQSAFERDGAFPVLIDGGVDAGGSGVYVASMLDITPQGIGVQSMDANGKVTIDETVSWR